MPAIGAIGGASTGLAQGLVQVIPINTDGTFTAEPDPLKLYEVSKYSDVAGLPAMTKRDPDQARGFIHAYYGLPNPGYRMANGFMPEVKTFSISAVAGYNNASTDNRESLTFALVPATWDPNVTTTPGSATSNVPPGPSPTAPTGTPPTNPTGPSSGSGASGSGATGNGGSGNGRHERIDRRRPASTRRATATRPPPAAGAGAPRRARTRRRASPASRRSASGSRSSACAGVAPAPARRSREMKRSSLALLLASTVVAALAAACSSGSDGGGLMPVFSSSPGQSGGATSSGSVSSQGATSGSSSGASTGSGSGGTSGGSSSGTPTTGGGSSSGGLTAPPDAGPGSVTSAAHEFFDATVYPELTVCQGCHSSGANGAPTMMVAPADTTYSSLDALGLIQSNSQLLTQGSHDTGAAPALTTQQQTDITTWLGMEAQERAGGAAPTNILADDAKCVSETEWYPIGGGNHKTTPRSTENPNKCTGCDGAICASCHEGGEYGFFMAEGSNIEPAGTTFQQTFQGPSAMTYIIQYFGLNGTTPVPSNAIMLKQTAVAAGPAYSHPMFKMSTTMQTALNKFVTDAITNYTNHTCTGGADGGAPSADGGP